MRALLIAAGVFFSICASALIYFAFSGSGHEYDLKLVLPVDTRQMPRPVSPPEVVSQPQVEAAAPVIDGRAETGPVPAITVRPLVQFDGRPGAASEAPPQQ